MRYYVSLDPTGGEDASIIVDVTELPTGKLDVSIRDEKKKESRPVPVDVVLLDDAKTTNVRVGGKVVDLTVEGQPPEIGAIASGHRSYVKVVSERQRAADAARKGGATGGDKIIKAPMPGRVVRVLVQAGAEVGPGTTLCVIEAMKMENEVKVKATATVGEVHVKEGATVEGGAKLFTLG